MKTNLYFDSNVRLIENVQRRATRMVQGLQTLSYKERLKKLELQSLEYRRRRETMIEMFKTGYNRCDIRPECTKMQFRIRTLSTRKEYLTWKINGFNGIATLFERLDKP